MFDAVYSRLHQRLQRQLGSQHSLRLSTIHSLIFTCFTVVFGIYGLILERSRLTMADAIYFPVLLWSILLFIHITYAYLRSGALASTREKLIHEAVSEAGDRYELDGEAMARLHAHLSASIQANSGKFGQLFVNALGNLLLWPGLLVGMILLGKLPYLHISFPSQSIPSILLLAVCGTLTLSFILPIKDLFTSPKTSDESLRSLYKRKRTEHAIAGLAQSDVAEHDSDAISLRQNPVQSQQSSRTS